MSDLLDYLSRATIFSVSIWFFSTLAYVIQLDLCKLAFCVVHWMGPSWSDRYLFCWILNTFWSFSWLHHWIRGEHENSDERPKLANLASPLDLNHQNAENGRFSGSCVTWQFSSEEEDSRKGVQTQSLSL